MPTISRRSYSRPIKKYEKKEFPKYELMQKKSTTSTRIPQQGPRGRKHGGAYDFDVPAYRVKGGKMEENEPERTWADNPEMIGKTPLSQKKKYSW